MLPVANADPGDDLVQLLGVGHGLGASSACLGLGHDLQQGVPARVQINAGFSLEVFYHLEALGPALSCRSVARTPD